MKAPFVIGHRGACADAPENTLASFALAFAKGAGMVECDVTLTRDGQVVVIHDETLDRTTDGRGPVSSRTLEEIRRLDAGAWFSGKFEGEKIPTLDEVLALVLERKGAINIEIKPEAVKGELFSDGVEARVLSAVASRRMEGSVLVSSFDARAVRRAKDLAPTIATAFLIHETMKEPAQAIHERLGCDAVHLNVRKNGRAQIEDARRAGMDVRFYTVNDASRAKTLRDEGAAGIFTDRPAEMLALLNPTD